MVCLIGVKTGKMENRERKIEWKMTFSTVCLRGGGGEKSDGADKFSLFSFQNTISLNWRENWEQYLDKTVPPLLMFLAFFFFFFFFDFSFLW